MDDAIVMRIDDSPVRLVLDDREPRDHSVVLRTLAHTESGLRKRATVVSESFGGTGWSIASDEGAYLGGADSAPAPLVYFAAGLACCLLTQLTRYHRAKHLDVRGMSIEQVFTFTRTGSVLAGTFLAGAHSVHTVLSIDSSEPPDRLAELARMGERMCFAAQAIMGEVPCTLELVTSDSAACDER